MSAFVIAHKESEELDTPVFYAGPTSEHEAIAIFTNREAAQHYVETAEWEVSYRVGELQPIQILKWFETAHEDGVDMVAVNPDRKKQLFGERQRMIPLVQPRDAFASLLKSALIEPEDEVAW